MEKFEFLEHTADIKFRAYGKTLNEAFENSVLATVSYLSGGEKIAEGTERQITLSGRDLESLLYLLLDEIIFLLDSDGFIVSKSKIRIDSFSLKATLYGDSARKYELDHIKAATYSEMHIKQVKPAGRGKPYWEVQAVLDV